MINQRECKILGNQIKSTMKNKICTKMIAESSPQYDFLALKFPNNKKKMVLEQRSEKKNHACI